MILSLDNVTKAYPGGQSPTLALRHVSVDVAAGEMMAVVGVSGSGKTTLLNLAAGLDRPTEGRVLLAAQDLTDLSENQLSRLRRRQVGVVFQSLNLVSTLTASENIPLPLALLGWRKARRIERVDELLSLAGMADRAAAAPSELSTGQQQRVAVLRAVAHRPQLVLLDEPTSALDTHSADTLMTLLADLNRTEGATMLLATHDLRLAEKMHRSLTLRDGKCVDDAIAEH